MSKYGAMLPDWMGDMPAEKMLRALQAQLNACCLERDGYRLRLAEMEVKFQKARHLLSAFETEGFSGAVEVRAAAYHDDACSFRLERDALKSKITGEYDAILGLEEHARNMCTSPDPCCGCLDAFIDAIRLRGAPAPERPTRGTR